MALNRTSEPAVEPVTLTEAKNFARVSVVDDDDLFSSHLIPAAREWVQQFLSRSLITQTWQLVLNQFPRSARCGIELPMPELQSVTSVQYIDSAGTTQTWGSGNYKVDSASWMPRLVPAYSTMWPVTRDEINAVTITYVAGYGDATSDVPAGIRTAIMQLATHWYENRDTVIVGTISQDVQLTVTALLSQYKVHTLA